MSGHATIKIQSLRGQCNYSEHYLRGSVLLYHYIANLKIQYLVIPAEMASKLEGWAANPCDVYNRPYTGNEVTVLES